MKTYSIFFIASILFGCSSPSVPIDGGGSEEDGGSPCDPSDCEDESHCFVGSCGDSGVCEATQLPVGTVCGGKADDGIHGECNADGVCDWTEWACLRGNPGDPCQGGFCAKPNPPGKDNFCCSGGRHLSTDMFCVFGARAVIYASEP